MKKIAALTGGIATGKSTIARMFQECSAHLIDADVVARRIVAPGQPAWREIITHFGQGILRENGELDRKKLGAIIFQHSEERQALNHITHPRVIEEIRREEAWLYSRSPEKLIIVDVPLLLETGMHTDYSAVILAYLPKAAQLQRLMERDQLSEEDARRRIQAQMPIEEKLRCATHVVNNAGSLEETFRQAQAIYAALS